MDVPTSSSLRLLALFSLVACSIVFVLAAQSEPGKRARKVLIAHRGASAYAPENTLPAYRLAMKQGADFVEQDLQITRDGVLVCLHDLTLERTTNVEEVFPDRFREVERDGRKVREWPVSDFTVEEISRLDAGSWFAPQFKGTQVPTWDQAIAEIKGKAGLFPETKAPEVYGSRGFEMEHLVLATLRRNGLDKPGADLATPVMIQSFSPASLRKLRQELGCLLPLVLLVDKPDEMLSQAGLKQVAGFARGLGPSKRLLAQDPGLVKRAHEAGLTVTSWTFRTAAEMQEYLFNYGVDALFTDNPDLFPRVKED
ncbi:MAG: glycerophosphodiester phosphodiesterase [Acidobacteria bacterium]|nr:MAG: glycerophosphodiester phosphodiesterase [Acidobacteriota bacterium]